MTEEELELKAKESFNNKLQKDVCYCTYNEEKIYKDGYIAGAKEILKENEQLKQGLKLYKKALELFVNWADECDFGYDNLGDLYSEYKDEIESLKYQEGLIHIAVSEAKKELSE